MTSKQKVVVWGYPLHTHTHSYGHAAAFKAFKYLGYETYWFHDDEYPKDFDYDKQIVTFEDELIKKVVKNNGQITLISLIEDSSKDESKLSENENYNNAIKDYETIINDFSR